MKLKIAIISFLMLINFDAIAAQDTWGAYQPRKLRQIIELNSSQLSDTKSEISFLLTADSFPSRVRVIYGGKSRTLTPETVKVIREWAKARKVDPDIVHLFEKELLFVEDSVEYWLPVQKQLVENFAHDWKAGEEVELFIIWIGAIKNSGKERWVFLVYEFLDPFDHKDHHAPPTTRIVRNRMFIIKRVPRVDGRVFRGRRVEHELLSWPLVSIFDAQPKQNDRELPRCDYDGPGQVSVRTTAESCRCSIAWY